jgi:lysophospholipase L1-like esterase
MNAGLAVLAVVVAGLVTFAFRTASATPVVYPSGAYTPVPVSPTTGKAKAPKTTLTQAKAIVRSDRDITIQVLGDSTGNDPSEWVDLWAKHLGDTRRVTLHMWATKTQDWDPDTITYGSSGPRVTIWNGSFPGARASYPLDRLGTITPKKPDLIVYSYGHNATADTIVGEMAHTIDAVNNRWPGTPRVAILQNPATGSRKTIEDATRAALKGWAKEAGLSLVDVESAFKDQADLTGLMKDEVHPNGEGEKLWAAEVARVLG